MHKVDTHQHFWKYNEIEYVWMEPGMEILMKDHLPSDLKPLIEAQDISGTVAVQARQTVGETEWLLQLADRNPFILGVIGWVDLRSPDVDEQLERFSGFPKLKGVRHVIHDEPDVDFMLGKEFLRGIQRLKRYNLIYELLIRPEHLPPSIEVVRQFPDLPFIVDHIAKPLIKDHKMEPWITDIRKIAEFPNVYCKVSGMVTEADWANWTPEDCLPYMDVIFESFGAERITLGSDWPVCTLTGDYDRVMQIPTDYVKLLSDDEQADVWGNNATSFYGL